MQRWGQVWPLSLRHLWTVMELSWGLGVGGVCRLSLGESGGRDWRERGRAGEHGAWGITGGEICPKSWLKNCGFLSIDRGLTGT